MDVDDIKAVLNASGSLFLEVCFDWKSPAEGQ